MASTLTQTLAVALNGGSLAVRMTQGVTAGQWEYYPLCNIVSITGNPQLGYATRDSKNQLKHRYPHDDMLRVVVEIKGREQRPFQFDIQDVTNQAGWTADLAGLAQAVLDLKTWVEDCCCAAGAATEITLDEILTELKLKADLTETQPVSIAGVVRTPSYAIVAVVGAGSVPAGARRVSIKNNGAVPVTIDAALLPVGESVGWEAGGQSDTLAAISYNIPATGSIQISKVL